MKASTILMVLAALMMGPAACQGENAGSSTSVSLLTYIAETDIQTAHPYANHTDQSWDIVAPDGTLSITLYFDRFETEWAYDVVYLIDGDGHIVHRLSGSPADLQYTVEGSAVRIRFVSDYSITGWGFSISRYSYEMPDRDHRPVCSAIGSRSEGWYWADTGQLIRFENCARLDEPQCGAIGSRSEGWYSNGDPALIAWDSCHRTVRIALWGEPCGPSIGFSCYDDLYCQGLPGEGVIGGTGTCRSMGTCEEADDCLAEGNEWVRPMCLGHAECSTETSTCGWVCDPVNTGPWSWTTVLLRDIESPHPYPNNYRNTWDVVQRGAEKIKVHFQSIETERHYDHLIFSGDREEMAVMIDGTHSDYWTPEFNGDTLHITLETDFSITRYGFRADMVSYYEQLPAGMCNRTEDCAEGEICFPHHCFNPYAPCYGDCRPSRDDHCDDGTTPMCEIIPPACDGGTIQAYRNHCYECVDPVNCLPPGPPGREGDTCSFASPCADGLFCKNVVDDAGTCRGELWCAPETVERDCENVIHIMVPGSWSCADNACLWNTGVTARTYSSDEVMSIPDNALSGIRSEISVAGFASCDVAVSVDVAIDHTYRGDLVVGLTDPSGARVVLHSREGGSADDLVLESFPVAGLGGSDGPNGTWVLDVSDHAYWDTGRLESWALHLECR
jgi:hypothetical protein